MCLRFAGQAARPTSLINLCKGRDKERERERENKHNTKKGKERVKESQKEYKLEFAVWRWFGFIGSKDVC